MGTDWALCGVQVYMLTPSGRFETQKKICLSISSFHPCVLDGAAWAEGVDGR